MEALSRLLPVPLSEKEARLKNPLALAFIGDTVWDLLTRQRLLLSGAQVNALHKKAVSTVNAAAQARCAGRLLPYLTDEESAVLRRGENAHSHHPAPKNQTPVDYSHATGLEALMGYLYLTGQHERLNTLFDLSQDPTLQKEMISNAGEDAPCGTGTPHL